MTKIFIFYDYNSMAANLNFIFYMFSLLTGISLEILMPIVYYTFFYIVYNSNCLYIYLYERAERE